jgi:galacturonosyltransferase
VNKNIVLIANHDMTLYNFRRELIDRLIELKFTIHLIIPKGKYGEYFKSRGCIIHYVEVNRHGKNPMEDLKLITTYKRIIKKVTPICVLTYTIKPNIYGAIACKKLGIPCIANITGLGTANEGNGVLQKIISLLYRYAFKKISLIFVQNESIQQYFEKKSIGNCRLRLVPGSGVNLKHFEPLLYPNSKIVSFLMIARIMRDKGIDEYLEAATTIRSLYPNTQFHVCGFCEDNYEEILKDYENRNIIHYNGMVDDVRELIKSMNCIILPSYHEGMSNALLEAAACARPVIATNINGCKETFDDNLSGFLVEPQSAKSLASGIEKFLSLSNLQMKEMGEKARQKVEREFDRERIITIYIDEIMKITEEY